MCKRDIEVGDLVLVRYDETDIFEHIRDENPLAVFRVCDLGDNYYQGFYASFYNDDDKIWWFYYTQIILILEGEE